MNYDNYDCRIRMGRREEAAPARRKGKAVGGTRGAGPAPAGLRKLAGSRALGAAAGLMIMAAAATAQAQFTIQPTTEALGKDTKIYEHVPTMNFSSNLNVVSADVGAYFASLLEFDLSSLSLSSAGVTHATLTLYCTGLGLSGGDAAGGTVTLSPILEEWRETVADAGPAPLATYDAFFGASPTLHHGPAAAAQEITGAGFYTWDVTELVQSWLAAPATNHGVYIELASAGGDIGFASAASNPEVPGSSPSLTVVPEPAGTTLMLAGVAAVLARRRRKH